MIDRIEHEIGFQRAALNLRAYRQELLASNIANADTPHYKARDINFKSALNDAVSGRKDGALDVARTAAGHLPSQEAKPFAAALKYRSEYQSAVDGNSVNMDVERGAFAENALQIEALLTFVREKFKVMQAAVSP